MQRKDWIPISSPIPLPLTMGTAGPPGAELPAERRLYCICLFAADSSPCCVRTPAVASRCVCSPAAHSDTHHPVIKMPAGLNKEFVGRGLEFQSSLFFPPRRTPETQRGSWRMTGVKYFLWRAGKLSERRELQVTAGIIMMRGFWSQD